MGNFCIVSLLHSVSDIGSSFYLTTIVYPFLSVRLYTLSRRLAVTLLFGECHDSFTIRYVAKVAADVSRRFGQQFTNALKVFVQHVPF